MWAGRCRHRLGRNILWIWGLLLSVLVMAGAGLSGCHGLVADGHGEGQIWSEEAFQADSDRWESEAETIDEDGSYKSKEEVALYLHLYGHLPDNYITKREAQQLGWDSRKGNLWEVAPGMSIGGSRFGNYEGQLPEGEGREYYECDIDYNGGRRGAKRIVYSNDGLVYYTEDHYRTFKKLYE